MELRKVENPKEIYDAMEKLSFPYHYKAGFETWEKSYLYDTDGESRTLFSELTTIGAHGEGGLAGYIQYGNTAFGFDKDGTIRDMISVPVIRSFYFDKEQEEADVRLLQEAVKALSDGVDRHCLFEVDLYPGK